MNILVTGGAGFIGSHVADAYCASGHRVAIIDNLKTGSQRNVPKKAVFYRADIRNKKAVERVVRRVRPHIVNHHAALVSVAESIRNPRATLETNVVGTANVIAAFGEYGTGNHKKFVFASTGGAIYGDALRVPTDETASIRPLSPYGLSKFLAEETVVCYSRLYTMRFLILRYANVYGPRQNMRGEAAVVPTFARLMSRGRTPTIFGDGTKTRDYVHVEDIARANTAALRRGNNVRINLGSGQETEDRTVYHVVARTLGYTRPPRYAPVRPGEVRRSALRSTFAQRSIGWKPQIAFTTGVIQTLGKK